MIPGCDWQLSANRNVRMEYDNTKASTVVQGIETEIRFVIPGFFSAYFNYSYNRGENKNEIGLKENIVGVSPHVLNFGGSFSTGKYLNLNSTISLVGKPKQSISDTRMPPRTYIYGTLCLIAHDFIRNLELSFKANNLLDSDIRYYDASTYFDKHYPVEGINFLFGISYKL
jgi:outer membrane receptor for ferrienterochelin and colicin